MSDGSVVNYARAVTYQQMRDGGLKVTLYFRPGAWAAVGQMKGDFVPELCAEGQGYQIVDVKS